MENNEFKKVCIKNRTCYCFDDITKLKGFDLNKNLIDGKSHENEFIHVISYENLIQKQIRFGKINGFVRDYDGVRYLILFSSETYDAIYNKIVSSISLKQLSHMFFLLIFWKSKLILITLCLKKKYWLSIKSVRNNDRN